MVMNQAAYNTIHDCLIEHGIDEPDDGEILDVFRRLPEEIKIDGDFWGYSDTLVRESIYEWIGEQW